MRKGFVPPGETANGKLYCEFPRWLRENVWRKTPESWRNNSCVLQHDNDPARASLFVRQLLAATNTTATPVNLLIGPHPLWPFTVRQDENPFTVRQDEKECQVPLFFQHWKDWNRKTGSDCLPTVLPITEIPLRSLYQFRSVYIEGDGGDYKFGLVFKLR